jgi:2-isopropylmalate synthase
MGIIVQPNKAIIGENAFGHESGIHTHGIINNPLTYEPISPELVGRKRWLQAGKHAGAHGIKAMLNEFGVEPTDEELQKIVEQQKIISDKGKSITTAELLSISGHVMGNTKFEEKFMLHDFHIVTGLNIIPTAVIQLSTQGKEYIASEIGVGPVDSALKAIQKIAVEVAKIKVREYRLESITGGSDALAEVSILETSFRLGNRSRCRRCFCASHDGCNQQGNAEKSIRILNYCFCRINFFHPALIFYNCSQVIKNSFIFKGQLFFYLCCFEILLK